MSDSGISRSDRVAISDRNGQNSRILGKLCKQPVTLEWHGISYSIMKRKSVFSREKRAADEPVKRTLLKNISGAARPGELVAIMGSSGAGKTTLLNTLAGRINLNKGDELHGTVLVNGKERDSRWLRMAGYVEQFDLMYGHLTVLETIQFAADFKLPSHISPGEKRATVDRVIALLGLTAIKHSKVGIEDKRGISGGEKKRVAIGIELVTFPGLLFLDEPTTGLDSNTALGLVETLRDIAEKTSMTIVLTIHQPRVSILDLFTRIMFISQGKAIYDGTISACLDHIKTVLGMDCPDRENPADFVMDLLTVKEKDEESLIRVQKLHDTWVEICENNPINNNASSIIVDEATGTGDGTTVITFRNTSNTNNDNNSSNNSNNNINSNSAVRTNEKNKLDPMWPNSRFREFGILLRRNFILIWRDKLEILAMLIQTIIMMLLVSFVYFQLNTDFSGVQGRLGLLFLVSVMILFITMNPLLSVFALDRAILMRERAGATYRVFPSYSAKFVSILPLSLLFMTLFITPIYFITGLTMPFDRFLVYVANLTALRLASITLGLFVASVSPTVKISEILGPLITAIFLLFGGNLANSADITWILRWIQYISLIFYAYEALAQNELNGNYYGVQGSADLVPGSYYLDLYSLDMVNQWGCLGAVLGLGLLYFILGYIGLRHFTRPRMTLKINSSGSSNNKNAN